MFFGIWLFADNALLVGSTASARRSISAWRSARSFWNCSAAATPAVLRRALTYRGRTIKSSTKNPAPHKILEKQFGIWHFADDALLVLYTCNVRKLSNLAKCYKYRDLTGVKFGVKFDTNLSNVSNSIDFQLNVKIKSIKFDQFVFQILINCFQNFHFLFCVRLKKVKRCFFQMSNFWKKLVFADMCPRLIFHRF